MALDYSGMILYFPEFVTPEVAKQERIDRFIQVSSTKLDPGFFGDDYEYAVFLKTADTLAALETAKSSLSGSTGKIVSRRVDGEYSVTYSDKTTISASSSSNSPYGDLLEQLIQSKGIGGLNSISECNSCNCYH